jgi:hypothetical protein
MLRKVLNFTFKRHPLLNLPEEHLKAIEQKLQRRASQLLDLEHFRTKRASQTSTEKPSFAERYKIDHLNDLKKADRLILLRLSQYDGR